MPSFVKGSAFARFWRLRADIAYLNHGSFGACPKAVLEVQDSFRWKLESSPWRYQVIEMATHHAASRTALAQFLHAEADDLVFVPNATHGLNTVLRSLNFKRGDELLTTDHDYFACRNAMAFTARRDGVRLAVAHIPFPLEFPEQVIDGVLAAVTPRTRFVLLDHVTSPTALVMPIHELVQELRRRHIITMVDGAHAPGMVPLDLHVLDADYYTGNCHKWICAPKGAAFLHVRRELQEGIHPLAISHVAAEVTPPANPFQHEFFWAGTIDTSAYLSIPSALKFMSNLVPGGWPEIMRRNRQLALEARALLCEALRIKAPCPEEMIGSMVALPVSNAESLPDPLPPYFVDPLQEELFQKWQIDAPVVYFPRPPQRLLRVSAQIYNTLAQYARLAEVLAHRH
ncbi:MAG TPA: aminotransferase class V-fold PLP-dependent enzyme [bacterium]|nr:aminotransferase class V-fold PLP-dependent enzyme [bacterium]HPR88150.1 aminotransferase class V-fold PLP-dependent enzyme [bacterium]